MATEDDDKALQHPTLGDGGGEDGDPPQNPPAGGEGDDPPQDPPKGEEGGDPPKGEEGGDPPADPPKGEEEPPKGEEGEEPEFFYNGEPVNVDIPDDLSEAFEERGLDIKALAGELYAKDGDFSLSDESREKLDEAFGKPIVDAYLNTLKNMNEHTIKSVEQQRQEATQAQEKAVEWSNELVGGEEAWTAMADWAVENLDDSELEGFNKAMQSGDQYIQKLAIEQVKGKWKGAVGDQEYNLEGAEPGNPGAEQGPIDAQTYRDEHMRISKEVKDLRERQKQLQVLDQRRAAGIKKNI